MPGAPRDGWEGPAHGCGAGDSVGNRENGRIKMTTKITDWRNGCTLHEYGGTVKECAENAVLMGADLTDAVLRGIKIKALRAFSGLYSYQVWAYVTEDGTPYVRMGCLCKTVPEWDAVTIRESNISEFPSDGSARSEQRARAFEFARAEALIMAAECAK